jgi:hypothetical protein
MTKTLSLRIRSFALATALVTVLLGAGCITHQVRQAIDEANVASISAELGLGSEDPSKPGGSGWEQASAKIEGFIAAHPENKSTIAALRVRQAMMLLNNRQYNLAKAAFGEAQLADLHTSRDRALKQLERELLWWYPTAAGTLPADEYPQASNRLVHITTVRAGLKAPEDEGIRDWLAAWRGWVALKMANDADQDVRGANAPLNYLEDAINTFASMLPAGETAQWLADTNFPAGLKPETAITGSSRRRFLADDLLAGAKKAMRQNAIPNPEIKDPYFRERLAR